MLAPVISKTDLPKFKISSQQDVPPLGSKEVFVFLLKPRNSLAEMVTIFPFTGIERVKWVIVYKSVSAHLFCIL